MGRFSERIGKRKQAAQGKISARLLEFAQPMIDQATERDGAPEVHQMENLLKVAITIWNAQVMEQIGRGSSYIEEVERVLLQDPHLGPEFRDMTRQMLARKREVFASDLRFISDFSIFQNEHGEFRVRAEARIARELLDEH